MASSYQRLTDSQWQISSNFLKVNKNLKHPLREILDGILYLVRTGCQWRNLPKEFPPYRSVFYHFRKWTLNNTISKINTELVKLDRVRDGRNENPSLLCIDCQSIKCGPMISESKGIDGNKKVNGRGRTVLTDSGGRVLAVHIDAANVHDGKSGIELLKKLVGLVPRVEKILYDVAYNGVFAKYLRDNFSIIGELSSKPPSTKGFVPLKIRWVIERHFGCINFFRRLDKDHEKTTKSAESMLLLASIQMLLQRIDGANPISFDKLRRC
jgi:putative transposase